MSEQLFLTERRDDGVVWMTLNRPEVHNAFDDRLIAALTDELEALGQDQTVRVLVLTGAGRSFSAGADLHWMRRTASYTEDENLADARALARLMSTLDRLPKATIARVNGAALGGGVGLVACSDVAIASDEAVFGTTEVRLGLIPAVIGPYVVAAIGQRASRRLMLSGERVGAAEAMRMGLVHHAVHHDELDRAVERMADEFLKCGPQAIAAAKRLIHDIAGQPVDDRLADETARRIAAIRASVEGKDGITAFLEKRKPGWVG